MKRLRSKPEVTLELVPLIDVVFLLLIFFMVTTTFVRETKIDLTLPEAVSGEGIDSEISAISLNVDKDGRYSVNGVLLDQHDRSAIAESLLLSTRPGDPNQRVDKILGASSFDSSLNGSILSSAQFAVRNIIPQIIVK